MEENRPLPLKVENPMTPEESKAFLEATKDKPCSQKIISLDNDQPEFIKWEEEPKNN